LGAQAKHPHGSFALLADGSTVQIRPASPGDADAVRRMHEGMSPENQYLRFFSISKRSAAEEARRLCRPAGEDHAALLAWQGGRLVGAASYEPAGDDGMAEVAFAVADDMHGRGVATLLLEHLVSVAAARGLRALTAQTLAENVGMQRVLADAGLPVRSRRVDGVIELRMLLPHAPAIGEPSAYLDAVSGREQRAGIASLAPLLAPRSVAVVGAGRRDGSPGRAIVANIRGAGFSGPVYPVNPHASEIEGLACFPAVTALPQAPDLAVIAVPPEAVAGAAAECGRRGVRALVVITSGMDTGQRRALLATCREHGMRLAGPNCFGLAVPGIGLDATFGAAHPRKGVAGVVVQSGGVGVGLAAELSRLGIGISSFASVGDKLDVSATDLLSWWERDGVTRLAVLYLESFGSPRKFARTARRIARTIPVLTVHAGRSAPGQKAAASHTAAAAAPLITRAALFEQAGIIATDGLGELVAAAALLAAQPPPAGNRVAIVSNAGGGGVLAADACTEAGLAVHPVSPRAQQSLRGILPPGAVVSGPVDTTAAASASQFRQALEIAAGDGADAVLALAAPTRVSDLLPALRSVSLDIPVAAVAFGQAETVTLLAAGGGARVPSFAYPEDAARALGRAARYGTWLAQLPGRVPDLPGIEEAGARALTARFLERVPGGGWLPAEQAAALLGRYGIRLADTRTACSAGEAAAAAAELGSLVAVKAVVPGLLHKSEAGAVRLGLHGPAEAAGAYADLAAAFGEKMTGALVQPMITGGTEVIIGIVQEPVFGPVVVFGLGGVATEVLGDHAARLAPLTDADAASLIRSIRAAPLLLGHRGTPPADLGALADMLVRAGRLAADLPEVAELDLNPVIARPDGAIAVDVRIRLAPAAPAAPGAGEGASGDPFLRRLR